MSSFEIEKEFDEIGELELEMEKEVVEIEACPECGTLKSETTVMKE